MSNERNKGNKDILLLSQTQLSRFRPDPLALESSLGAAGSSLVSDLDNGLCLEDSKCNLGAVCVKMNHEISNNTWLLKLIYIHLKLSI